MSHYQYQMSNYMIFQNQLDPVWTFSGRLEYFRNQQFLFYQLDPFNYIRWQIHFRAFNLVSIWQSAFFFGRSILAFLQLSICIQFGGFHFGRFASFNLRSIGHFVEACIFHKQLFGFQIFRYCIQFQIIIFYQCIQFRFRNLMGSIQLRSI